MLGVCLTVITVIQIAPKSQIASWIDNVVAIDGLLFMGSTLLSYLSLRTTKDTHRLENYADRLFLVGMCLMALCGMLIAFEFV